MKPKILLPFLAVLAALTSACSPRLSVPTPYLTASPTFVVPSTTPLFVSSAVSTTTSPAAKETQIGFNVRGWT